MRKFLAFLFMLFGPAAEHPTFTFLAPFRDPIIRLAWVYRLEKLLWVQVGSALIIEYPKVVGLNPDNRVGSSRCQIQVPLFLRRSLTIMRGPPASASVQHARFPGARTNDTRILARPSQIWRCLSLPILIFGRHR